MSLGRLVAALSRSGPKLQRPTRLEGRRAHFLWGISLHTGQALPVGEDEPASWQ